MNVMDSTAAGTAARPQADAAAGTTLLDLSGLRCPVPIVRLNAAVKDLPSGHCLDVRATDPAFELDVQAWCRRTGHALLCLDKSADGMIARVKKGG